ncbi:hypothetical protein DCAR_0832714 [Daucus carota subsp. sativus]|uniref:Cytochrome P450 n=3 Tax=Daucus carota subsp. sativus TaxID=79200 RepID=A0AAF1BBD4_DAUCS|nr:hypothetical protein DCAR_0832714 [Daucus carota subsp. sativus]
MEWNWNYVIWSALICLISLVWSLRKNSYRRSKLPPGPKGWPLFGNLFDLGSLPHRSLEALKQDYGPVVWLDLGSVKTMVLLSAAPVEELFKSHDLSFINRITNDAMRSHDYYQSSIAFGPYSVYWRTLRRICTSELFANKRLNETMMNRQKSVDEMLLWIQKEAERGTSGIIVRHYVFPALFNMIGNVTLSQDLVDPQSKTSSDFGIALDGFHQCLGRPNISDLLPWLRRFDLQGIRRKMDQDLGKCLEIISVFVKERVKQRQLQESSQQRQLQESSQQDFLDVLLDYRGSGNDEPAKLSEFQVTIFLMEMFIAGTDTTSSTTEWALSELLQNPEQMKRVKAEISSVVGANKQLKESDTDKLHYLQAIVDETLRLHPPAPILLPRKAVRETNFMGYTIPKDTQVLINNWAIGRDKDLWEDPLSFKPERFLDSKINYKGQNYEFLPFGAGRRICPGLPLAHRMVPLVLGSLLHHFEWELCDGVKTIDMRETLGSASKKLELLRAVPKRKMT